MKLNLERPKLSRKKSRYRQTLVMDFISLFLPIHAPTAKLVKNFCSAILTLAPHQSQVTSSRYTCGSLYNNAVVYTSMMIGHATAVYYVHAGGKFTISEYRGFGDLENWKISFSVFWSQSVKYCPRQIWCCSCISILAQN